jgi:nickel/cobalt exporter
MSQTKNSILALIVLSALCPLSTHAFVNPSGSTTPSTRSSLSFNSIHHHYQQSQSHSKTTTRQHLDKIEHGLNLGRIRSSSSNSNSRTRMNMVAAVAAAPAATGAAAAMGVISGGILGGALHAIAGPDHLAALLPKCCGQRWYRAGRIGAIWGMGHGISATILGLTAFGLKSRIANMPSVKGVLVGASSVMEVAVGFSLIFIGLLGIKEAKEWKEEIGVSPQSLSSAAAEAGVKSAGKRAVIFNGILHGFSWDGAPSLAPALAVATWRGSLSFLLAYAVGTMAAMSITTTLIGEGTRRAGQLFNRPDIPQKLSLVSSVLAMGVGAFWCVIALK